MAAVLLAASIEVFVITLFGGTFAKRIAAGMGGMRNSPEEEVLLGAMSFAFNHAMWIGVASLIALAVLPKLGGKATWPEPVRGRIPIVWLTFLVAAWSLATLHPQTQLARNVQVEGLIEARNYRDVLDYMGQHQPADFAQGRPLPPQAFEREVFEQLPKLFATLLSTDPEWVRRHCLARLDQMLTHYRRFYNDKLWGEMPRDKQIDILKDGIGRQPAAEKHYLQIIEAMKRIPEGGQWFLEHEIFLRALAEASAVKRHYDLSSPSEKWRSLELELERLGFTNQVRRIELGHETAPVGLGTSKGESPP